MTSGVSGIASQQGIGGCPRSPKRTWAEKDGRSPTIALAASTSWVDGATTPSSSTGKPGGAKWRICSAPVGAPDSSLSNLNPQQKCHPDRSEAKWRDLLFIRRSIESEWKRHPPLCHPDRSVA